MGLGISDLNLSTICPPAVADPMGEEEVFGVCTHAVAGGMSSGADPNCRSRCSSKALGPGPKVVAQSHPRWTGTGRFPVSNLEAVQ